MEEKTHQDTVEEIKGLLTKLGLPNLPPHTVYCDCYHPDVCTRINHKFVVIEYINSKDRFNWDLGGLCILLLHKDIIEFAIAVLSESVYNEHKELLGRIEAYRNPLLEQLIILPENNLEGWLEKRIRQSKLWKTSDLLESD